MNGSTVQRSRVKLLLFALRALPALLEAAVAVRQATADTPIHQLPARLRRGVTLLPAALRRPQELAALADRLAPVLPPPARALPAQIADPAGAVGALRARPAAAPRSPQKPAEARGESRGAHPSPPDFHACGFRPEKGFMAAAKHEELWSG